MSHSISIGLVDDHQIVLDGLMSLLKDQAGIRVVFATTQPELVTQKLVQSPVDILIMDMAMPICPGSQLAKDVGKSFPSIRVLVLSMSGRGDEVNELINEANISGYALKNIGREELLTAIRKIANGGIYFADEVLQELKLASEKKQRRQEAQLTNRELEIIQLIEKEYSNRRIAEELFISERTVETHRKNIFRKTGTNTILGLIKYAYHNNLIRQDSN